MALYLAAVRDNERMTDQGQERDIRKMPSDEKKYLSLSNFFLKKQQ
jgi:hypothetical protein